MSLGQDVVYAVSNGAKWTPKYIGLGSTLHQVTRSKQLVDLFNKAGHILSYKQILKIDTALAQETLASMNNESGAVVPPNLNSSIFTHFTADNIDINDSSVDGKNTFHATQVAAWQRGPETAAHLSNLRPSIITSLDIPDGMQQLDPVNIVEGKSVPLFADSVQMEWYTINEDDSEITIEARAKDMTLIIERQSKETCASWSSF